MPQRLFRPNAWEAYKRGDEIGRLLEHDTRLSRALYPLLASALVVGVSCLIFLKVDTYAVGPAQVRLTSAAEVRASGTAIVSKVAARVGEPVARGQVVVEATPMGGINEGPTQASLAPTDGVLSMLPVSVGHAVGAGGLLFAVSAPGARREVVATLSLAAEAPLHWPLRGRFVAPGLEPLELTLNGTTPDPDGTVVVSGQQPDGAAWAGLAPGTVGELQVVVGRGPLAVLLVPQLKRVLEE